MSDDMITAYINSEDVTMLRLTHTLKDMANKQLHYLEVTKAHMAKQRRNLNARYGSKRSTVNLFAKLPIELQARIVRQSKAVINVMGVNRYLRAEMPSRAEGIHIRPCANFDCFKTPITAAHVFNLLQRFQATKGLGFGFHTTPVFQRDGCNHFLINMYCGNDVVAMRRLEQVWRDHTDVFKEGFKLAENAGIFSSLRQLSLMISSEYSPFLQANVNTLEDVHIRGTMWGHGEDLSWAETLKTCTKLKRLDLDFYTCPHTNRTLVAKTLEHIIAHADLDFLGFITPWDTVERIVTAIEAKNRPIALRVSLHTASTTLAQVTCRPFLSVFGLFTSFDGFVLNNDGDDALLLQTLVSSSARLKRLGIVIMRNGAFKTGSMDASVMAIQQHCRTMKIALEVNFG